VYNYLELLLYFASEYTYKIRVDTCFSVVCNDDRSHNLGKGFLRSLGSYLPVLLGFQDRWPHFSMALPSFSLNCATGSRP